MLTSNDYINGILQKDRIILSKAITLIESNRKEDEDLAEQVILACTQLQKSSKRIAVTGSPGAGKSTFINAYGKYLLDKGQSVAVLAVDPSSTISKGSILADKTRMEDLINDEKCFIRPTASSNNLGGVAKNTRASIILCEAFGFDYIFVETVGVGQSETMVKNMTDLFILLLLPNSGDELQGIKRGIMEMADIILIHKSDSNNLPASKVAAAQVSQSIHFFSNEKNWIPRVVQVSSTEKTGLSELQEIVENYFLKLSSDGFLKENRNRQQIIWFEEVLRQELEEVFLHNHSIQSVRNTLKEKIRNKEITATNAAKFLLDKFLDKNLTA